MLDIDQDLSFRDLIHHFQGECYTRCRHPSGHIDQCYGITKAYTTRLKRPLPTELSLEGSREGRCRWSVTSSTNTDVPEGPDG